MRPITLDDALEHDRQVFELECGRCDETAEFYLDDFEDANQAGWRVENDEQGDETFVCPECVSKK